MRCCVIHRFVYASLVPFLFTGLALPGFAFEVRQWSDATGKHKMQASLSDVVDGVAVLNTTQGKTVKIPVEKLSKADRDYLEQLSSASPFEEVDDSPFKEVEKGQSNANLPRASRPMTTSDSNVSEPSSEDGSSAGVPNPMASWQDDLVIDWGDVDVVDMNFIDEWDLKLPESSVESFTPKRTSLKKKFDNQESLSSFCINSSAKKAVLGYTYGKIGSDAKACRITLIDLPTGRLLASDPVPGLYGPMTTLNDGVTVVMRGMEEWRDKPFRKDELQLWRISGKKVARTNSWKPFVASADRFGRSGEVTIRRVVATSDNRLIIEADDGQLGCIDAITQEPYWYAQLSREHSIDLSPDGSMLAVTDMGKVMILDPVQGVVLAATQIESGGVLNWPAVKWSPSGKQLLFVYGNSYQVLDLSRGEWGHRGTMPGLPIAMAGVAYPDDDYMLVGGKALIHLPSMIHVCDYSDGGKLEVFRGVTYSANQANNQGIVFGVKLPHPQVVKFMEESADDPNLFIIRPGVEVSINASGTGQHAAGIVEKIRAAAEAAEYKVVENAPLQIVATIGAPESRQVNYMRQGERTVSVTSSKLAILANGKEIWAQAGDNLPWFVHHREDESFESKLQELTKDPNLGIFQTPNFPRKLQKPAEGQGPNVSNALARASLLQIGSTKATAGKK